MVYITMTRRLKHKSFLGVLAVTSLGLSIAIGVTYAAIPPKKFNSPTEKFITQNMRNTNGTFSTYLKANTSDNPDIVAGREALSESLGLWLQYSEVKQDQLNFNQGYDLLTKHFLTPQNYIVWKLQADGVANVQTNALGDDLRIVGNLLKGYEKWPEEKYLTTARVITETLQNSVQKNGYFVDFHDFNLNLSTSTLSLVYADITSLQLMRDHQLIDAATYEQYVNLLLYMPKEGAFFPKSFDVDSNKYSYEDDISLIDQLIVGIHLTAMGEEPEELLSFLKKEFKQQKRLYGRYNRLTQKPTVTYESPAVYGLGIILALKCDDQTLAKQLNNKMLSLRGKDAAYPGGYVFNKNTHIFDNLFPLIAEASLYSKK